ncbi:hypothetical protein EJB05_40900, partial [Eragrostis curvula]
MAAFLPADLKMSHQPSKQSTPHDRMIAQKEMPSQPSVIARLMGIDAIPMPVKPAGIIHAEQTSNLKSPPRSTTTEIKVISPRSAPFKQAKCSLLSYRSRAGDSKRCLKKMRITGRPRSRQRHPQEDLLQKIKEDFQSWQASKALKSARTVAVLGNNSKHLDGRCIQIIAQENLRKEKMARYGYGNNKHVLQNECSMKNLVQTSDWENATKVAAEAKSEEKKVITILRVNHYAASEKFRDVEVDKEGHNRSTSEKLRSPAQIVLLKPSSDIDVGDGEVLFGLSKVKRDDNMEEFLQKVKERLQKELKVKCTSDLNTITWASEPTHVAQNIAAQIKQTVTTDLSKRLSRSEAFRAFRSDRKRNHATTGAKHASPEHIKIKNARSILSRRPKNVTPRTETNKDDEESVDSFPIRTRERVRSLTDVSLTGIGFDEQSWTSECVMKNDNVDSEVPVGTDILSQCKLVRSFSAPESGLSRSRLFSDESVNNRKHGASDIASESGTMTSRSSSFSFRETVSSLRHSFSLRGKLFGRKKKPSFEELYPQMAIGTSPSPSESFRLYNIPQAKLSPKCPSEFEAPASELLFRTDITVETACNQDKAYIREVLIAAGLYDDGSLENKVNARVDSMARPICDFIFEEVEDIYYYRDKNADHDIGLCNNSGVNVTDHRMLFDLANEALHILVQGGKTGSSLRQWVIDSTGVSRGRKLVDDVWQQVQTLRNPQMQEMQTIDSMVAFEVRKSVWAEVLYEDVYVVGRKIERAIFDELIEDLLLEVDS